MSSTGIQYGNLNLQTDSITVHATDIFSAPKNTVQADKLSNADGAIIVKSSLDPKTFSIEGTLRTNSVAETDALIDTFKTGLSRKQQNLDIDYAGSTRRYVATAESVIISRPKGLRTAGFSVQFVCASPVGSDVASSTLLPSTPVTTSTAALPITVGGSYLAEPVITVTVTSVSGGTAKTLTVSNGVTLRGIAITRNWVSGDVLVIDSLNKTVYVNNAPVPFDGQFPKWDPDLGGLSYLDNFTSRSVTITAEYTRRWL